MYVECASQLLLMANADCQSLRASSQVEFERKVNRKLVPHFEDHTMLTLPEVSEENHRNLLRIGGTAGIPQSIAVTHDFKTLIRANGAECSY
jgi:hypothetical protein